MPEDKINELSGLIFQGRTVAAIKLHRELTGLGLKDSKEAVEKMEAMLRKEAPEKFTSQPSGCSSAAVLLFIALGTTVWLCR